MSEYFLEPKSFGRRVKVELDLSIYATKANLIYAAGVITSTFAKEVNLTGLKCNVDN